MTKRQLENGTWEYTFDHKEDHEVHSFLIKMAEKNNVELESPEFHKMVNAMLEEALKDEDLLEKIKKINE